MEWLGATLAPPPLGGRLSFEPADGNQAARDHDDVSKEEQDVLSWIDSIAAYGHERAIEQNDDPALPRQGRAPPPPIALGPKPILGWLIH
jgi:hypothetical protein